MYRSTDTLVFSQLFHLDDFKLKVLIKKEQ